MRNVPPREAGIATDTEVGAKLLANATRWATLRDRAARATSLYEEAIATRHDRQRIAEPTLRIAQAADLELRRREPWALATHALLTLTACRPMP
jgi:hypothetical protein